MSSDKLYKNTYKCELCGGIIDISKEKDNIVVVKNDQLKYNDSYQPDIERLFHLCDKENKIYGHLKFIGMQEITEVKDPTVEAAEKIIGKA